ncbi:MAG: hypothetical protein PF638_12240 [Candidatus Delongbacteria bacterium]|nr:hypothetical protein [Candidatus Delongbacteria bacterium]
MNIDYFNNIILELWKAQNGSELVKLAPLLYNEPKKNSILFIGINPSFSKKGFISILKDTKYEYVLKNLKDFYSTSIDYTNKIYKFKEIEEIARKKINYFNKFRKISKESNLDWDHIDLLQIRETNQQNIKDIIKENKFLKDQIKLSVELINYIKPKMIVVENALARRILFDEFNTFETNIISEKIDKTIGTYRYLPNNNVPIFFTGMLTGQHALDNGSYERLKWHIKFVLDKEKEG